MSQPQSGEIATLMQKLAHHVAGGLTPQQGAEVAGMLRKLSQHVGAPAAEVSQLDRFFQSLRRVGFPPRHAGGRGGARGGGGRAAHHKGRLPPDNWTPPANPATPPFSLPIRPPPPACRRAGR